ncbi:nucleotide sugar dehydrogenase [Amylibacter sp.]|nr:nucleotide sugar dehydrogenase [Amylibacter sp.]
MEKISVVGLGKLGACTASCLSFRGFETLGIDINPHFVDDINNQKAPVLEPRLQEMISGSDDRLEATLNFDRAIDETDVTLIIVPTPSKEDGNFSDKTMREALTSLCQSLKNNHKKYHLFVITSTVSPKTCEKVLIPLIEAVSGRILNHGFGMCYNPEFIALGNVVDDTLQPDFVLIGESDKKAGDILQNVYEKMTENEPAISRMSLVSAEITKISLNAFVTMKISFANTLTNICEKIKGSELDHITTALGNDKRISPYYIKGGLSFGGPCFPRDNRAFAKFASEYGVNTPLAKSTDEINKFQIQHLLDTVEKNVKPGDKVGILGLSFKPNTPVIEESPGIFLIKELLKNNTDITVYDAIAIETVRTELGSSVDYSTTMQECVEKSNIVVITTMEPEFKNISISKNKQITLIDCWRQLSSNDFSSNVKYHGVGLFNEI